ncbi:MAG: hypothetical protein HC821_01960, partial [Lewinella sp.]|nr:hypothetical protein [Lewinella sp.]
FDVEAKDFRKVYDLALDSKTNRRHYRRQAYDPKGAMLELLDWEPEFVRAAFIDLFDEGRELEGRLHRFVFYCQTLFSQYRLARPKSRLPDHYHDDDYQMATLYLTAQYPERYAPYSSSLLLEVLGKLGAQELPVAADVLRYNKLLFTLHRFLKADPTTLAPYTTLLRPQDYAGASLLPVWHFMQFVRGKPANSR